jgi:hypothetical protein
MMPRERQLLPLGVTLALQLSGPAFRGRKMKHTPLDSTQPLLFGRRRMAPRVCVVDHKPHIRTFLAEALEDLGFLSY